MIAQANQPKIELSLNSSGMTRLHRAGVAGLYMTLKELEKRYPTLKTRQGDFQWILTSNSISLHWRGEDFAALDWLFKESFKVSDHGLISLTGLNSQLVAWETQLATHIGIQNTFLQHNKFLKSAGDAFETLTIDGLEVVVEYKKAQSYAHQDFAKKLCDRQGKLLQEPIGIKGWLYPGAVVKHYAFEKQTQITETIERALALLFAPVAGLYFISPKSLLYETKTQYNLVIADIDELKLYARMRQQFNNWNHKQFYTSGYKDAGLRFLTHLTTLDSVQQDRLKRCQVTAFGQSSWSKMQKIRQRVELIEATKQIIRNYQLSDRCFQERVVEWEEGNFIASSIVRELIAENLVRGFPWWHNFAIAVKNNDLFRFINYEREGLHQMVRDADWDEEAQKLFVKACHEALLKIYAKIHSRIKEDEYAQIERENKRIWAGFVRCQNSENFRQFLVSFWSKAGQISILEDFWQELMPLTTKPENWKVARDLALLALVSYKKKETSKNPLPSSSSLKALNDSEE